MPLQIKSMDKTIRRTAAIGIACLIVLAALSIICMADGGFYTSTSHGNTTNGVSRDPLLPTGSCAQCHVGHGANPQDFGLWVANDNALCFTCHANTLRSYFGQTNFNAAGHTRSSSSFDDRRVGLCVQCHNPHGAGDSGGVYKHMTSSAEELLCFKCHGTGFKPIGASDIETDIRKPYSHDVTAYQRLHDDAAESASISVNPNPALSGAKRHVECADCHNTHYGRTTPRAAQSSNIGQMLLGSWGVRPIFSAAPWVAPTNYVVVRFQDTSTELEYYLCVKCHSNWSFGNTAPYTKDGLLETNTAMEISPSNPSYHNVTGQLASTVPTHDVVFGTATPPAYVSPWGPNSAMACTDCHSSDTVSGARGAHGSTYSSMLKKRYKAQAGASDNTGKAGTQADLCFDCHDWNTYGAGGTGTDTNFRKDSDNLHQKTAHQVGGCAQCHSSVPHGAQRQHLIVYATDDPPYAMDASQGIMSYTDANGGSYQISNCTTVGACHGN
ncbi:MAG: cytochrome c3 family protein [Armatimonadota bacterium]